METHKIDKDMPKMNTSAHMAVAEGIARRAGLYGLRYLTKDGRVILSEADLRRVRLSADEYLHGLDAVEIQAADVETVIAEGGYRMLPDQEEQAGQAEEPAADEESSGLAEVETENLEEE